MTVVYLDSIRLYRGRKNQVVTMMMNRIGRRFNIRFRKELKNLKDGLEQPKNRKYVPGKQNRYDLFLCSHENTYFYHQMDKNHQELVPMLIQSSLLIEKESTSTNASGINDLNISILFFCQILPSPVKPTLKTKLLISIRQNPQHLSSHTTSYPIHFPSKLHN